MSAPLDEISLRQGEINSESPASSGAVPPAHIIRSDEEALATARNLAVAFAQEAADRDRERRLPLAEVEAFSQSGLWSINVPEAYGGPGVSYATVAQVSAIIAAADPSLAQIPQSHLSLIDLIRFKPEEESRRALYQLALNGVRFGNAVSETGGKTVKDLKTRIIPVDGGFLVSGQKFYATGALFAHVIPVAVLDEDKKSHLAFIDRSAQGLTVIDDWSGFGQRTTASGTVILDNVFVASPRVVPSHLAYDTPSVHGPISQIIHAGIDLGIGRGAIADTVDFVRSKTRPWVDSGLDRAADDPYILRDVGDLHVKLHAAEEVLWRAGRFIDEGLKDENAETVAAASIAVAEARVLTTEIALLATNKLFELAGTSATLGKYNLDRHWRNARTHTLHDPVRWKYHAIGNYVLNGIKPPRNLWI